VARRSRDDSIHDDDNCDDGIADDEEDGGAGNDGNNGSDESDDDDCEGGRNVNAGFVLEEPATDREECGAEQVVSSLISSSLQSENALRGDRLLT
jgi:hypothetical protein